MKFPNRVNEIAQQMVKFECNFYTVFPKWENGSKGNSSWAKLDPKVTKLFHAQLNWAQNFNCS